MLTCVDASVCAFACLHAVHCSSVLFNFISQDSRQYLLSYPHFISKMRLEDVL